MNTLAIIGIGPRGLYALENLLLHLSNANKENEIFIFEASEQSGSGNVWHSNQPNSNWINITERALDGLEARPKIAYGSIEIAAFPSYHNWCDFSLKPFENDQFPPRNKLGKYLNERYNSIIHSLDKLDTFQCIKSEVQSIDLENQKVIIKTNNKSWLCNDVLLTIGHQNTEISEQIKDWKLHIESNQSLVLFENTYPIDQLEGIKNNTNVSIGIRGFGLAMIDAMRYLTINNFGNFKVVDAKTLKSEYYKLKDQNIKLVPFSLDGLPMVPKPLNENIDNWYKPTIEEINDLKSEIESVSRKDNDTDTLDFLISPIAKIASRIFIDLKDKSVSHSYNKNEVEAIILKWLKDADFKHQLLQDENITTYNLIRNYIDMALGKSGITLDFCIGQVWRHCQPTLYKSFSHAKVNNSIIEEVIALDERSKRYSYGPPIESMQQMLALVDANVLTLDYVNNPEIKLVNEGWLLKNSEDEASICSTMINSVIDSPKLLEVNSSLIKNLLKNELIQPIHSKLGIETSEDGYVITPKDMEDAPIAVLGRLAKGSVIGVDAILECFGSRVENWAEFYVNKRCD